MNKILILYKSKYGATKKYAYMLKKEIACDVFDIKDYQKGMFDKYELVIFASAIYASGISGLKVLKKNYAELKNKKVIIFCVGASPYDKKAFDEIRAYNLKDDLKDIDSIDYDGEFMRILEITKEYGQKYDKEIPVIAAGGISTSSDVKKYINMGAAGVQVGTLFVATEECDANITFKNTYIKCKKEDIKIVKSPVGLPGRAIYNKFLEKLESNKPKIKKCYNCMETCNPSSTPYCISQALINAVNGDIDNALLFCGAEAYKINKIKTVKKVIDELISEI